ncbi:hypothetical protein [Mucilaginibacter sp.]|uniref:hypothetical protein n=1 Tax=Mucilaginibacter sp. TaxID=1882438 RepID=UPI002603FF47|nr:hypothetical protein [Mucilaginibacter sp.]MDB4923982.1 hypothetical protein [Mucilaginibacter sp.]
MKFKILITISCLFLLSACTHVYSPALYHQDIAYQPKPASFDTEKAASYISAGLNTYTNTNLNDAVVSGQLNLSRGYVFDNFNIAYGAFGVLGDYQNGSSDQSKANYFNDKFFGAVGGRASINAYVHSDRADFRFIGLEAAYSHEFGDYATYRQMLQNQGGYYVDPRTDLFTIGLTTEVIFHNQNNNDFEHGIRGFLGTTVGHNNLNDTYYKDETATTRMFRSLFPKASYFIKYKDYFGTIEAGNAIFLRVGYKF